MDNSSSDGRGDEVECTRQAGSSVAGEGRIPGMPELSSTSAISSAAPAGLFFDGVAPNPCPQLGTPFTLPGDKRVAVGAPDTRWGGGNTWEPLHFSAIADAIDSGLGSTHGNIISCWRNLNCKALLLPLLLLLLLLRLLLLLLRLRLLLLLLRLRLRLLLLLL